MRSSLVVPGLLLSLLLAPPGLADEEGEEEEGGPIVLSEEQRAAAGITLALAGPGTVQRSLELAGRIRLNEDRLTHVVPRVSGVASRLLRSVGDRVARGDALAILESTDLGEAKVDYIGAFLAHEIADMDLARSQTIAENTRTLLEVLAAKKSIVSVLASTRGLDVGKTKSDLLEAYARLSFARSRLAREEGLRKQNVSSIEAFQEAKRDLEVATVRYAAAEEDVRLSYQLTLASARRAERVADNSLHHARHQLALLGVSDEEVLQLAERHGAHHEKRDEPVSLANDLRPLDRSLATYTLTSPIDGIVLERRAAPGEWVDREDTPFVLGNLTVVWVDLAIHPHELASVRAGQEILLRPQGLDEEIRATVAFVHPVARDEERVAFCRVLLKAPGPNWKPGLFVSGTVFLEARPAKVVVPRSAVTRQGHEHLVFAQTDQGLEPREVRLGRQDLASVEILHGLRPGEKFAATGAFLLKAELSRESLVADDD